MVVTGCCIIWVSAEAEFATPMCQVLKELQAQELTKVKRTCLHPNKSFQSLKGGDPPALGLPTQSKFHICVYD